MSTKKAPVKKKLTSTKVKTIKSKPATKSRTIPKSRAKTSAKPKTTRQTTPTTKRATPKRTKKSPKTLVYATDAESFWVSSGEILNSLVALCDALQHMDKQVFTFHATGESNDFSLWVRHVLQDVECAYALQKAKTPRGARVIIMRHLKLYAL